MKMKKLKNVVPMLVASLLVGSAYAADEPSSCRLKGGSVVPLPPAACALEGGTTISAVAPAPASAATAAPAAAAGQMQLSADPMQAAAQKAIVEVLNTPVVDKNATKGAPEGIDRAARFAGCKLLVDEDLHLDYGSIFLAQRRHFKVSSTVDFQSIRPNAFGVLGKISSAGGSLKAYAVYVEEKRQRGGNHISIAVSVRRDGTYTTLLQPGPAAYWDAPRDDLWMADEYGYAKGINTGSVATDHVATDTVRILFMVNSADDAAALKKAFDDLQVACSR